MIDYDLNPKRPDGTKNPDYGKIIWISSGSLNYTREHNEWILWYLQDLRAGKYPLRLSETGYTGGGSRAQCSVAPFERACDVAAELDRRLSQTGLDRILVEMKYIYRMEPDAIARYFGLETEYVERHIESAVSYISSGDCPRWLGCQECGEFKSCRKGKRGKRAAVGYGEWRRRKR